MIKIYKNIIKSISVRERKRFFLLVLLNTVISLMDIASIVFLLVVIGLYTTGGSPITHYPLLSMFNSTEDNLFPAFLLLLLFLIKNTAGHAIFRRQSHFIENVATRISEGNLEAYLYGDFSAYAEKDTSLHIRNVIYTPTEFAQYVLLNLQMIITEAVLVSLSVIVLLVFKTKLFLILILTLLPAVFILLYVTKKKLDLIKGHIKTGAERSLQYVQETLEGFVESNIYNKNGFFVFRHRKAQKVLGKYISDMKIIQDLPSRCFEVFAILGLFTLLVITKMTNTPDVSYTMLINTFMAAAYKIIPGTAKIVNLNNQLRTYLFTLEDIHPPMAPLPVSAGRTEDISSITICDLTFSYKGNTLLAGFNASFRRGTLTGIYGPSGRGKTTLFHLLLSFNSPQIGRIYINDKVLQIENKRAFWQKVSYVKQTTFLLHTSILDNIVLFEKEFDNDRLQRAMEISGIRDHFPEGKEKMILEGGKNISGGQRQRIMLARALYKDYDVLLLDEPFSEIDSESEVKIMEDLQRTAQSGKIIILISHNRNVVSYCDFVIDLGKYLPTETNA